MKSTPSAALVRTSTDSHNALLALGFGHCPGDEEMDSTIDRTIVVVSTPVPKVDPREATRPMTSVEVAISLKAV